MIFNYFEDGKFLYNSQSAVLLMKIPSSDDKDFNKIKKLKNENLESKISNNDFDFSKAKLFNFTLNDREIESDLIFDDAIISGDVNLRDIKINGSLNLNKVRIDGNLTLNNVDIKGSLNFDEGQTSGNIKIFESQIGKLHLYQIKISELLLIRDSKINFIFANGEYKNNKSKLNENKVYFILKNKFYKSYYFFLKIRKYALSLFDLHYNSIEEKYGINGSIYILNSEIIVCSMSLLNIGRINSDFSIFLEDVKIYEYLNFIDCYIKSSILLKRVTVDGDCIFNGIRIKGSFDFTLSRIREKLDFEWVIFYSPYGKEAASRQAKRTWEKLGDSEKTDKYCYDELEAKRKNKWTPIRYAEKLIIQIPFGYGIKFYNVVFTFIGFIILFGILYSWFQGIQNSNTIWSNLYISILIALKTGYQPSDKTLELLTSIETVFGVFLYAITIVIFARKFFMK